MRHAKTLCDIPIPNTYLLCTYIYPYLTYGCVLWCNNYEAPLSQLVRLQNKAIRINKNVPLCDHITPLYVNLDLIKLPDIVKLYTCQLLYDHLIDEKPSNYTSSYLWYLSDITTLLKSSWPIHQHELELPIPQKALCHQYSYFSVTPTIKHSCQEPSSVYWYFISHYFQNYYTWLIKCYKKQYTLYSSKY